MDICFHHPPRGLGGCHPLESESTTPKLADSLGGATHSFRFSVKNPRLAGGHIGLENDIQKAGQD
jgi:hypothetical protein